MAEYKVVKVPTGGAKITMGANKKVQVPDNPIIPYIEGDGTGRDIWRASARVFDAAVEKAYKGKKKIHWMEVYAGEKSFKQYNSWLHEETVPAFTERLVRAAIQWALNNKRKNINFVHKGNIMKYTEGAFMEWGYAVGKREFRNDVVSERESWILGNKEAKANISVEENAKLIDPGFDMMSPAQQGDIKQEVEEALKLWPTHGDGIWKSKLMLKDSIADVTLQFVLIRPKDYDVIATLNLNGDYLSDALAAQVGGIGIAPGANINYDTGHAVFEATHGTAPKYANLDKVNPGSVVLSGEMMLRYLGWTEAADLILKGMDGAIASRTVTYDFARLMEGAKEVKCSEFGTAVIAKM